MDPNIIHLLIAGVATVVCVVVTALIWRRAQVKTVFWWIGLTLLPMAVYLAGLGTAAEGAARTLYAWWNGLQFTPIEWVGLVLGGLGITLVTYGLQNASNGWGTPSTWGALAVGVVLLALFGIVETRTERRAF